MKRLNQGPFCELWGDSSNINTAELLKLIVATNKLWVVFNIIQNNEEPCFLQKKKKNIDIDR